MSTLVPQKIFFYEMFIFVPQTLITLITTKLLLEPLLTVLQKELHQHFSRVILKVISTHFKSLITASARNFELISAKIEDL